MRSVGLSVMVSAETKFWLGFVLRMDSVMNKLSSSLAAVAVASALLVTPVAAAYAAPAPVAKPAGVAKLPVSQSAPQFVTIGGKQYPIAQSGPLVIKLPTKLPIAQSGPLEIKLPTKLPVAQSGPLVIKVDPVKVKAEKVAKINAERKSALAAEKKRFDANAKANAAKDVKNVASFKKDAIDSNAKLTKSRKDRFEKGIVASYRKYMASKATNAQKNARTTLHKKHVASFNAQLADQKKRSVDTFIAQFLVSNKKLQAELAKRNLSHHTTQVKAINKDFDARVAKA